MSTPTCLAAMYHYVRDSEATPFPGIRALPPALFEQQLDWLQRQFTLIGVAELEAAIDGRGQLPANAAMLTFDDGFVDHYATVVPILRERGLTGAFFLALDACGRPPRMLGVHKAHFLLARLGADAFAREVLQECAVPAASGRARQVFGADRWELADERAIKNLLNLELPIDESDRVLDTLFTRHLGSDEEFARGLYLNDAMIVEMARAGMTFGCHTRSHRMLSRLTPDEQQAELAGGVAWIRSLTDQERVPFCYPWGGARTYTADTMRILGDEGYSLAFNTVRRRIEIGRDGRFELPRIDTRDLPPYTPGEPAPVAGAEGEARSTTRERRPSSRPTCAPATR
jgi:peptidoglycan/xylan/chitin deacetylase (PgdA/CDA1 family)